MNFITLTDGRTPLITTDSPKYIGSADISKIFTQVQAHKEPNTEVIECTLLLTTDMQEPLNMSGVSLVNRFYTSTETFNEDLHAEIESLVNVLKGEGKKNQETERYFLIKTIANNLFEYAKPGTNPKSHKQLDINFALMKVYEVIDTANQRIKDLEVENKTLINNLNIQNDIIKGKALTV